jgi:hypothetical protein
MKANTSSQNAKRAASVNARDAEFIDPQRLALRAGRVSFGI